MPFLLAALSARNDDQQCRVPKIQSYEHGYAFCLVPTKAGINLGLVQFWKQWDGMTAMGQTAISAGSARMTAKGFGS
jgi:hypothetical protein